MSIRRELLAKANIYANCSGAMSIKKMRSFLEMRQQRYLLIASDIFYLLSP